MTSQNRYEAILEAIFMDKFKRGMDQVEFERSDLVDYAERLGIEPPKNLGDLIYSFRYRANLPASIQQTATGGRVWIIRPAGKAVYRFAMIVDNPIEPNLNLAETKIPDATPGIVAMYALSDEQALLAKVRYNRLVDIFSAVTCYSLQNHLRTSVPEMGQVETDEIYVGVDKRGAQFVFPLQAKGGKDRLSVVQIEQDFGVCEHKFPDLICRPIAAQFMKDGVVALFELERSDDGVCVASEKHYKLVSPEDIVVEDLRNYRDRFED